MSYGLVRASAGEKYNLRGRVNESAEKPDATFTWLTDTYKKTITWHKSFGSERPKIFLDKQSLKDCSHTLGFRFYWQEMMFRCSQQSDLNYSMGK